MKKRCSSQVRWWVVYALAGCLVALDQTANAQDVTPVRTKPGVGPGAGAGFGSPAKVYQSAGVRKQTARAQDVKPVRTKPGVGPGGGGGIGGPARVAGR
ncbi:MAG: hypothetical protein L0Z50_42170 [Verrucomicrobiales bacterium]|nr:hypothetical protein [Verrucomicrobiales bacterium]